MPHGEQDDGCDDAVVDRLKVMPVEPVVDFTDSGYQSQLPDHQRSTAVQSIRNNLKSSELQLCDNLATRRQLVSCCSSLLPVHFQLPLMLHCASVL